MAPLLALGELTLTAQLLAVFGGLAALSVLISRTVDRLGIPVLLLFLALGILAGTEGLGAIDFGDYSMAMRLGMLALVLILFDGGLNTSIGSIRVVLWPAMVLATFGVAATAGLLALLGRMLGLEWREALMVGAIVSSTDAAAVFAVLRGGRLQLRWKLGRTLEVESCVNDPMAVILTTTMIDVFLAESISLGQILLNVPLQLAIGTGLGVIFGYAGRWLVNRVRLGTTGLYAPLMTSMVMISFGVATLMQGSGFLAVYAMAVVLGNGPLPNRAGMLRFHDGLAWLSQVGMFLMFGLLVFPSRLPEVMWVGMGVALLLACVARPVAVLISLLPFRLPWQEVVYISWIGLRGAVPIILATFPVLAGVPGAERVFDVVFFIVVVSCIIPGATIRPVTRWLKLNTPERPVPEAVLEINSLSPLNGELVSYHIDPSLAVCGAQLSEIDFPAGASIVLLVRNGQVMAAKGNTRLEAGDHVYVLYQAADKPFVELLFGPPEAGG